MTRLLTRPATQTMRRLTRLVILTFLGIILFSASARVWASSAPVPREAGQTDPVGGEAPPPATQFPPLILPNPIWPAPPATPSQAVPKGDFTGLKENGVQGVRAVVGPLTLQLDDGRIVQLAGLDIPDLDPYAPGDIAVQALQSLTASLTGQKVRLFLTPDARTGRMNRMGHTLAHLERVTDGSWVQGSLLAQGLARARPSAANPQMTTQMLALEDTARQAKTVLWALPDHVVRTTDTIGEAPHGFAIVEGVIDSVSTTRNRIYLNFGKNWKKDFTVGLDPQARQTFAKQGLKPLEWGGRRVRARGWLRFWNGPYMDVDSPESLEFLDAGHVDRMAPALEALLPPSVPAPTVAPAAPVARPATGSRALPQKPLTGPMGGYIQVTPSDHGHSVPEKSSLAPPADSGIKDGLMALPDRHVSSEPLAETNR
jgi:micrococcal nuclease